MTGPALFLLAGSSAVRDTVTERLIDRQTEEARREDANLLYVAMTRARQYLFVSGTESPRSTDHSWYAMVRTAADDWDTTTAGNPFIESGTPPVASPRVETVAPVIAIDPRLAEPVTVPSVCRQIAPSHSAQAGTREDGDADGRERGRAIHLMLEHLTRHPETDSEDLFHSVAAALQRDPGGSELQAWWQEAVQTCRSATFAELFDPRQYAQAFSEVPVQYLDGDRLVYGIIDRLVLQPGRVLIIDYKTHRSAAPDTIPALVEHYRDQMRLYAGAAGRLWPGREIKSCLLFTACAILADAG